VGLAGDFQNCFVPCLGVEIIQLYWFIAEQTVQKQQTARWGDGLIKQVSQDLQQEFPEIKGFSVRNLELMRKWYRYWTQSDEITKQVVFLIISDIYRPLS
jgi:predicted nuclease of restriction endonuclease-like (RecB) superfamily